MYNKKFISFLKKHNIYDENVLKYLKKNATYIDYQDENARSFIGCYPKVKNNTLIDIKICIPKLVDNISVSMNIHEYVHLLDLYYNLWKKYNYSIDSEILPVFYELLFIRENKKIHEYENLYREYILEKNQKEYLLALEVFDDLIEDYNKDSFIDLDDKKNKILKRVK